MDIPEFGGGRSDEYGIVASLAARTLTANFGKLSIPDDDNNVEKKMSKVSKIVLNLLFLIVATLVLTAPARAQAERGRVVSANLSGAIAVQQEDGTTQTVDYEGRMRARLHGERIVIDIIHAGVIRETGESVTIIGTSVGVFHRARNEIGFNTAGSLALERENGSRTVVDIAGAGIIRRNGRNIVIDITAAGVVQGSDESVRIDITGAGPMGYVADTMEGDDI